MATSTVDDVSGMRCIDLDAPSTARVEGCSCNGGEGLRVVIPTALQEGDSEFDVIRTGVSFLLRRVSSNE